MKEEKKRKEKTNQVAAARCNGREWIVGMGDSGMLGLLESGMAGRAGSVREGRGEGSGYWRRANCVCLQSRRRRAAAQTKFSWTRFFTGRR